MRRILPFFLCAATFTLSACDQEPVSGPPTTDDQQALYDFRTLPIPEIPGYLGNGDITLSRAAGNGGGDGGDLDIILWDVVGVASRDSSGTVIQQFAGETILDPQTGQMLCTTTTSDDGLFKQLRDAQGTVLFSSMAVWTFDGAPDLEGKNIFQQYQELSSHLRFSYDHNEVIEGFPSSGDAAVTSSAPLQFASAWRKLVVASLVDGHCGSDGID